jgi:PAS domain S-box-containing protein
VPYDNSGRDEGDAQSARETDGARLRALPDEIPAHVLQNMPGAVTLADQRGVLLYTNPAAERMFGYGPGELLGKHVKVLNAYPPEENERLTTQVMAQLRASGAWVGQWDNIRKDGSRFTTRARITTLVLEGAPHWICVQDDITEEVAARRHAEALAESLRASERQLRLITDSLPALVTYMGPDRRFRFANNAYMTWFGIEPQSLIGKHARELVGEVGYRQIQPHMERALAGETVHYERDVTLPDGRTIYTQMSYVPDKDEQGRTLGYVALIHDMTDRHRAELELQAERKRLHDILMNAPAAIALRSASDGVFRFVNAKYQGMMSGRPMLGKTTRDVHPEPTADRFVEMIERVHRTGEAVTGTEVPALIPNADGGCDERFMNITYQPLLDADGRIDSLVSFAVDVTEQVQARRRAESLREQAEAGNRAKDEFLALLGHELRNPLSPILTALELMKLRDPEALREERAIIERQVEHVVRLVDDLLDVSRITRGMVSLERRRIDVAKVIERAIELASPLVEQRAHRLSVDLPAGLIVDGDPLRLSQVFANLLTNAAKYTPRGGAITIAGAREGDRALVSVIDTGIGIRASMLPRVFDLFAQERQELDRSEGGLGLGLSIVRSLVEQHGGKVEAHSAGLGHGSEFRVFLPLTAAVELPAPQDRRSAGSAAPNGLRVLVVDDNEDAAKVIGQALRVWSHIVRVAHDGPSALRLVETFKPDLALLDIGLPAMDGYELARRLRALPGLAGMRLVAVTGYGQARDREAAQRAGFHEHMVKPVTLAALEQVLSRMGVSTAR